jgi:predicted membrane-bound spermidine synthase
MKSNQLADVLIKVAGLFLSLSAVPGLVSGLLIALAFALGAKPSEDILYTGVDAISTTVQAFIGLILIFKSRKIANFWFKNEEE